MPSIRRRPTEVKVKRRRARPDGMPKGYPATYPWSWVYDKKLKKYVLRKVKAEPLPKPFVYSSVFVVSPIGGGTLARLRSDRITHEQRLRIEAILNER